MAKKSTKKAAAPAEAPVEQAVANPAAEGKTHVPPSPHVPENAKSPVEKAPAPVKPKTSGKTSGIKKVHFHLKDGNKRTFHADEHGDDFLSLADQFEGTNGHKIAERINE